MSSLKMDETQNINNLCRTCMTQLNEMLSVFDTIQMEDANIVSISYILMECASVEIISDDSLPKNICNDCLSIALQSYLFKQNCHKAQQQLIDIIEKQDLESHLPPNLEIVINNDILDSIVDAELYDCEKTNSGIEYFDTEFSQIYGSDEQIDSDLIAQDDLLNNDVNDNLYGYEGTEYLNTDSDQIFFLNESVNSLESEMFVGFKNDDMIDNSIEQSVFLNVSDGGELPEIQFTSKCELWPLEKDPIDDEENLNNEESATDKKKQKEFYCCFCDTIYLNRSFFCHIKTCEKKPEHYTLTDTLICPICKEQISRRSALIPHRVQLHPENVPNRIGLEECMDTLSKKNKYCNFCDCLVPHDNFVDHIENCEKRPENCTEDDYTRCPICKQVLCSHNNLTRHRMNVHGDNIHDNFKENAFICKKCGRIFLWYIQYRRHLAHCNNENGSKIDKCEKVEESEPDTTSKLFCEQCKIEFQNQGELDIHSATHKEYKSPLSHMLLAKRNILSSLRQRGDYCCFCDTVFSTRYFDNHIKTCDKKPENYKKADSLMCPICKQRTTKRCTLLIHRIEAHKKNLPNYINVKIKVPRDDASKNSRYCNFCDSFMHYKQFSDHINKCEKRPEVCTEDDHLRCPVCKIVIYKRRYLTKHRMTAHPDNLPDNYYDSVLECKYCHQKFFRYFNYSKHLAVCKGEDGLFEVANFKEIQKKSEQDPVDMFKMYCKLCKIRFTEEEVFNQHIEQHGNMNVYLCKICGNIYKTYFLITLHVQIHGEREKFLCSVCGKDFKSPKSVEVHMRVHTGEKPFACDKCEMRFSQKSSLKSHFKNHSDKKEYKCWICDVTFKRCNQFNIHMRDHKETIEGKQYTCEICTRTFSSSIKLKIHTRIHKRRSRVHLCKMCDRSFSSAYSLKIHTRSHTGEKPYICPVCKKGFPQGVSLNTHMKLHKKPRVKRSRKKIKQENVQ